MVEVAESFGGVVTDSEGALLERLTLLADERPAHKKTLEAAKSRIQGRRDLDEVIGAALQDVLAFDREHAMVEEELQELQAQRETLRQAVEDIVYALQTQLAWVASSLKGVLDLLSNASASIEELQNEVSSLVGHLDKVAEESWDGETPDQLAVEFEPPERELTGSVTQGPKVDEASVYRVEDQLTSSPTADTPHTAEEALLGRVVVDQNGLPIRDTMDQSSLSGAVRLPDKAGREQKMLDVMAAIYQHEAQLWEIGEELEKVGDQLTSIRNGILAELSSATDERGRHVYANEQMRRAEVDLRMDRDERARALRGKLAQLENEHSQVVQEIGNLRARFTALQLSAESD